MSYALDRAFRSLKYDPYGQIMLPFCFIESRWLQRKSGHKKNVRVTNDLLMAEYAEECSLKSDLTVAFDTVGHSILIDTLNR